MEGPVGGPYPYAFGRCPIVLLLGDFLQLPPTGSISVAEDLLAKDAATGKYIRKETPCVEVQSGCKLFRSISHVFELHGTKRFVRGDVLGEFLVCMRKRDVSGSRFPPHVWEAFEKTFADDAQGTLDPRHSLAKFRSGYGIALYWETLARWMPLRARREARAMRVPLVCLQAYDQCNSVDREAAKRLLNVPNIHNTGDMHGAFLCHRGMCVRLTKKLNATVGLVQNQTALIVEFVFEQSDAQRYRSTLPGEMFRPRFLPAGIWLQVDGFTEGVLVDDLTHLVCDSREGSDHELAAGFIGPQRNEEWWEAQQARRARGLFQLPVMSDDFKWQSKGVHPVKRDGFPITHAAFHTSTSVQGHTLRTGVTIDCARIAPSGMQGLQDDTWWFHLYVMFSRATRMEDMLLLRPPPRELLERGPPRHMLKALCQFEQLETTSTEAAMALCREFGIQVPAGAQEVTK